MNQQKFARLKYGLGWLFLFCGYIPFGFEIFPNKIGTAPMAICYTIMMVGAWLIKNAEFMIATAPVRVAAVINGLDGQDWELPVLMGQGQLLAPSSSGARTLKIAQIRSMRPDDMPQLRFTPIRENGRSDGKIIGAKVLGRIYLLPY